MHKDYDWMMLYEAAVLETNLNKLPGRIEDAKYAIGQRVVKNAIDEDERLAVVKALNALAALKRDRGVSREPGPLSMQRHARFRNSHERQNLSGENR
jgi:hypothetical protein